MQLQNAEREISHTASFFKALGDPTRLRILFTLSKGELCVNDIADALSMTKSAVSHQLRLLKAEGLVKARREGKNIYYSLDDDHVVTILTATQTHIVHKIRESEA